VCRASSDKPVEEEGQNQTNTPQKDPRLITDSAALVSNFEDGKGDNPITFFSKLSECGDFGNGLRLWAAVDVEDDQGSSAVQL
jgi:hypothetical protein